MNAVAENLKTARTAAGLTQEELAEKLAVTRQAVSSWETGRSEPDIDTLLAIAQALDTDVSSLLYGPREAPYRQMQRKYLACFWICLAVVIAGLVCRYTLGPALIAYRARTYDGLPYFLYLFSVPALASCAGGVLAACIPSLFTRVRVSARVRVILLTAGVLFLAAPLLFSLQTIALMISSEALQPVFTGLQFAVMSTSSIDLFFRILPFFGGAFLFCGLNR